jgi:Tol biopolymer transport system component
MSIEGGAPVSLALARDNRGGCWSDRDEIIFAPDASSGLLRIPAHGGEATPLTQLAVDAGEMSHRWPRFAAGAGAVLFTVKAKGIQTFDDASIDAVSLRTGERTRLLQGGTGATYSPTGHVVYARAGALLAAPFDPERLAVTGPPFTTAESVSRAMSTGSAHFDLSQSGTLVYLPASVDLDNRRLVRVDPQGRVETLARETRPFLTVRTSPDGRRLALWMGTANDEIWTYEIDRGILERLTPEGIMPLWSPDGEWVIFEQATPHDDIARVRADGSAPPDVLLRRPLTQVPTSVSPDGRLLAFAEDAAKTGWDIWTLSLETGKTTPVLRTPSNESAGVFSPDGRLLAYVSDETGRNEVYVQAFPGPGARQQVSVGGGTSPAFAPGGRELFYQNGSEMMAVSVRSGGGLQLTPPRKVLGNILPLSTDLVMAAWDLAPGGRGFVMPQQLEQRQASTLMLVLNWTPDHARKASAGD